MTVSDTDALLVIDVQNDFVDGTMAIPNASAIIGPINALAAAFTNVVIVTDWHPADHVSFASAHPSAQHGDSVAVPYGVQRVFHDHCVQESWGADLHPGLRLGRAQMTLRKGYRRDVDSYGCFFENDQTTRTGLAEYLRARSITRVFCTGLARFGCVAESALGGVREGFTVFLVEDASAGRPKPDDAATQDRLRRAGVEWTTTQAVLGSEIGAA